MKDESIEQRVLQLREVEQLSMRQIANTMGIGRKRVKRILDGVASSASPLPQETVLAPYMHLIGHWYHQYPRLKATQVYMRLKSYGYQGSYASVVRASRTDRMVKPTVYHTLTFLPGEEAQIDWFFFTHDTLGKVAGFIYLLAYSRYAWGIFYPKTSFEFFLAGHLECFHHIGGLAHRHRYDNIKSVVLTRSPHIEYNPQFMDFCRFYGFSVYLCNPYRANEKGRVERLIRDIRVFLYGRTFVDITDLNRQFHAWLTARNNAVHRSTAESPRTLLSQERLLKLPHTPYAACRVLPPTLVSKTALAAFENNTYSVPSTCASKKAHIIAYPEKIDIAVNGQKVATHRRSFQKNQLIRNPLHSEKLLEKTPHFKMQRVLQLIQHMDPSFDTFLAHQEDTSERMEVAYQLFLLLKSHSKAMIRSAVRELNAMKSFKIKALRSLLNLPEPREVDTVWPHNAHLLNLHYEERSLQDYDPT